ncbi:MAG: type III pantothenate kinase, partial [Calditrichaeota bacterium]|nr:type III pantothenate kinase [Calditrichota bacterium]
LAISSVVPNITQIFIRMSEKYFGRLPFVVENDLDLGIRIDYQPKTSVGADRICNAVAVLESYGGPAVVVDFGTATTFDVVSEDSVYLGGIIAPGLETASWGLHERASKLPKVSFDFPASVIGKSTDQSLQAGLMLGTVSMIDGLIDMIAGELNQKPVVVATGGLSNMIAPRSRWISHVEKQLVLLGLMSIYRRNRPNGALGTMDRTV